MKTDEPNDVNLLIAMLAKGQTAEERSKIMVNLACALGTGIAAYAHYHNGDEACLLEGIQKLCGLVRTTAAEVYVEITKKRKKEST